MNHSPRMASRGRWLAALMLAAVLASPAGAGAQGSVSAPAEADVDAGEAVAGYAPWPMFRRDPRHTGRSPIAGARTGRLGWHVGLAVRPSPLGWVGSPAVGGDGTVYIAGLGGLLHALDASGATRWRYQAGGLIDASSPAVGADGTVYVGASDGALYAVDPGGTFRWRYQTGGSVNTSPTLGWDGTIFIPSEDGYLYAIRPDGTLKWRFADCDPLPGGLRCRGSGGDPPAIGPDGTVYFASDGACVDEPPACAPTYAYALHPDGGLKWRTFIGATGTSAPAVTWRGTAYFGATNGYLYAVTPGGRVQWRYAAGGAIWSAPAIGADGTVYIGGGGFVHAVRPNGTPGWRRAVGVVSTSSPAVGGDGAIYVATDCCHLHALGSDGTLRWRREIGGSGSSPAIGGDGTVYVTGVSQVGGGAIFGLYAFGPGPSGP